MAEFWAVHDVDDGEVRFEVQDKPGESVEGLVAVRVLVRMGVVVTCTFDGPRGLVLRLLVGETLVYLRRSEWSVHTSEDGSVLREETWKVEGA